MARFTRAASIIPNLKISVDQVTTSSITVVLSRLNPVVERDARIFAPRFPKAQSEGWFVIVGDLATDEVFAVKRVGWSSGGGRSAGVGSRPSARAAIKLPEPQGAAARKMDVLVVSDGYIGLEYKVYGVEIPAPPAVDPSAKSLQQDSSAGAADGPS